MGFTLEQLSDAVINELQNHGYSSSTVHKQRVVFNELIEYSHAHGAMTFQEELGEQYLSEKYGYPQDCPVGRLRNNIQIQVRAIRNLGDYQQFGLLKRSARRKQNEYPEAFKYLIEAYDQSKLESGLSLATIDNKNLVVANFTFHLVRKGIVNLDQLTPTELNTYFATFSGYSNSYIKFCALTLREFLKYAYDRGSCEKDLSTLVPHVKRINEQRLPPVWTQEEIDKILSTVDRGNPMGKRDYAILLLIARLGLRRSDVEHLKLESLHWNAATIELVQVKTGNSVILPLLDDVGEAIIDYLKYARPKSGNPYVFLKMVPPFNEHVTMGDIMNKYVVLSGVEHGGRAHGLHSLRHTLASRLLEKDTPLPIISAILGHAEIHSTEDYLHIDIEGLRKCALELEAVSDE